jgi:hypothetical protein
MEDIIGVVGVSFVLITYYLLQIEKIDSKGFWYSFLNLFGAVLIMYSLMYNWNLASVIIEIFWIAISAYGVWKYLKRTV